MMDVKPSTPMKGFLGVTIITHKRRAHWGGCKCVHEGLFTIPEGKPVPAPGMRLGWFYFILPEECGERIDMDSIRLVVSEITGCNPDAVWMWG